MNIKLAWAIVGLLVLGGLFMGIQGVVGPASIHTVMMQGGARSAIDQHFIEEMIPHHEGAIAMAQLALERSKRPEIITLAHGIIAAQTKEIGDMRGWYKDWFGTDVPQDSSMMGMDHGGGMMAMRGMQGDMDELKVAKDFDKEFLSQMIVHHEMAVMMARMLESGTARPEMKQLATNIITSQTNEIQMMHEWLTSWYEQK